MLRKLIITTLIIFGLSYILPGVNINNIWTALIAAIVLGLLNTFLKPILLLFSLPVNIITLGLFTFIINAFIILLVSHLVSGLEIINFGSALFFILIISFINLFINSLSNIR